MFQLEEGVTKEDGEGKEEPDFIETHCHWKDCDREYGTQDELVKVRTMAQCLQSNIMSLSLLRLQCFILIYLMPLSLPND